MKRFSLTLAAILLAGGAAPAATPDRPNVLLFLVDDLGSQDLGVEGSKYYETPVIDALAASGVRFSSFYSAHPVCSPTRAALMTGKVPQRVGITDYIKPKSGVALPATETTIGEAFAAQGYQTGYVGKWHLGEADSDQPAQHGFQWTAAVNRGGQPASYYYPYRKKDGKDTLWDVPDLEPGTDGDYLTDALTGKALEFLKQRDATKPFLLCFSHYAVHTPIQPPAQLVAKYQAKAKAMYGDAPAPPLEAPFGAQSRPRQDEPAYAALLENLDTNIGRVLKVLEDQELREKTIVVFTSDNGGLCTLAKGRTGPTSNLPLRCGKGWNYEGGIRTPCYISWPGHLKGGTVTSTPAYTPDLYPTLLELSGLPQLPEQHLDGRSLASLAATGKDGSLQERPLAWYYPHEHGSGSQPSAALRLGSWKLIHFFTTGQNELYDLTSDPGEQRNLSTAQPEKTRDLHQELMKWVTTTNSKPKTKTVSSAK